MTEPLELKKTVNLPKTDFSQKANLAQSEPARLKKWTEMGLYERIRGTRRARKIHPARWSAVCERRHPSRHGINKILKDFIVKSRTMMGFDAPYVPGYDCHGLPIEMYVEQKLAAKGRTRTICRLPRFAACAANTRRMRWSGRRETFQRLGILGEWDNPYLTMSDHYEAETARLFGSFSSAAMFTKARVPSTGAFTIRRRWLRPRSNIISTPVRLFM